ncbi:skin secretory protein xP2 isoform X2 [Parambassis ranga]|uniref:Skin secretory protein xP2 isoform X2 n=1 Tax=Parambassis ranga TaxID=210632 RepID=A0A6P7I7X9_9TELE|nr:skin secretory protein xP2-like isoform X2 [Parambassis ranga]
MEETAQQQEKQESEYKDPDEEQGGIRRRLRDRELLRKRKAEAEEKETNQLESQRKRSRADDTRGMKKRGRPRKTEPMLQTAAVQEEAAASQKAPALLVVPETAEVIPGQIPGSLTTFLPVQLQPASAPVAPVPAVLMPVQSPVFAPSLTSPAPIEPTLDTAQAPVQDMAPAPVQDMAPAFVQDMAPAFVQDVAPAPVQDMAPSFVQDMAPAPVEFMAPTLESNSVPDMFQDTVPDAAPDPPAPCPTQVGTIYTEPQSREGFDQVLIEDLGPDEEEDISPSQDKRAEEDVSETLSINVPEQNRMYSFPALSSPQPLPQEYLPGN